MKYRLLFWGIGLVFAPSFGAHLSLSQSHKFDFIERRLAMIESLLATKKAELARLEAQAEPQLSISSPLSEKIINLREDLKLLTQSLPVLKNSLYALRTT